MNKIFNFNSIIELIKQNLFIFLFIKIFIILFFIVLFILWKWPLKKIITLVLLLIIITIMLIFNNVIVVFSSFFVIIFFYIAFSMYLYFKTNETKFLLINKLKQNQDSFNQSKYSNSFNNNIKEKAREINKWKYKNSDTIINNEILSLYANIDKAKYKYQLFASITWIYKKISKSILVIFDKYKFIFDLILIDIKLILIIIMILNLYNIINTIYVIRFMQLFFQFN